MLGEGVGLGLGFEGGAGLASARPHKHENNTTSSLHAIARDQLCKFVTQFKLSNSTK